MYQIGLDIGSSTIKVSLVEASSGANVCTVQVPEEEMVIESHAPGFAEQDPQVWWEYICQGIEEVLNQSQINPKSIEGIGIAYQMHGLVLVDRDGQLLRKAIIWCDSRAVDVGDKAYRELGETHCRNNLLNAPGNFTASKLKWVKDNEPDIYERIHKFMLPGDYIAYRFTGDISTTSTGLSEGIFWNYSNGAIDRKLMENYGIDLELAPKIVENFTEQGNVSTSGAEESGIPKGVPVKYRAGDQPNNAFTLNVLQPGEIAMTGGTSGVIYGVTDKTEANEIHRYNHFIHVNHNIQNAVVGKLLCINGSGILYSWLKKQFGETSFEKMNMQAANTSIGSNGLMFFPFGNGAERMFLNKNLGATIQGLDLNRHTRSEMYRAGLEGIAFSFVYGLEIMKSDQLDIQVIRAGNDNLFRSQIFAETITSLTGHKIEIYNVTGSVGAARACGLKQGEFEVYGERVLKNDFVVTHEVAKNVKPYQEAYQRWRRALELLLKNS